MTDGSATSTNRMRLSVVVPVYNERETLPVILADLVRKRPAADLEIVVVDDCSTDGSREWLQEIVGGDLDKCHPVHLAGEVLTVGSASSDGPSTYLRVFLSSSNQGKGAALRAGFARCSHEAIVIQDADLEYDPADLARMWLLIVERGADVVYGSRFYGMPHRSLYLHHYLGNRLISRLINLFCNSTLSDIEVCYKMFRKEVLDEMRLRSNDFGFEVEFTVKSLMARKWTFYELGISYYGRTYEEGKKINWRDGVKALWYIFKFRFVFRR